MLWLISSVERPESIGDISHFGETVITGRVKVSVISSTKVCSPQGHTISMDAASWVAFFVDCVAWLECTHSNLRIPIPSKGPLVDVGTADQDILVIKDLKINSYVI